jgi:hypothetical protein
MSLHKDQRRRAQRSALLQEALYRNEIRAVVERRSAALESVAEIETKLKSLILDAVTAGLGVTELARITGFSRPTVYRMLAEGRQTADYGELLDQLIEALGAASKTIGRPALRRDLADHLGVTEPELIDLLIAALPVAMNETEALGPIASVALLDGLSALPTAEKIAVNMALNQRVDLGAIARAMQIADIEATIHLMLGLLRLMPLLRAALAA